MLVLWASSWSVTHADVQTAGGRVVQLTLIIDYEEGTIQFDGKASYGDGSPVPLDLTGLPLDVEREWKNEGSRTWYIQGKIKGGTVVYDQDRHTYYLLIGAINLRSQDKLEFHFPFVNLDYAHIQPSLDPPDPIGEQLRGVIHGFTYKAGVEGENLEIPYLKVPFTPIEKRIDLVLTPLIGEVMVGKTSSLRLSGKVSFESLKDYEEFSRHCQNTSNRLEESDYRAAHLSSSVDYPHDSAFSSFNSSFYQSKPTRVGLRTELLTCQYDQQEGIGRVEAAFSGNVSHSGLGEEAFPLWLQEIDSPDGNYPHEKVGGVRDSAREDHARTRRCTDYHCSSYPDAS